MLEDLKEFTRWFVWIVSICFINSFIIFSLFYISPLLRNNTDLGKWGGGRSGMNPMTDALTGCQYLTTKGGGLIARVDGKGKHVGCNGAE